ncbi:uncharacterized LabA/DUF88 family protein [Evansella vedderi]|uniref:Uncharacterized LabA/DUF88 family protein n=1 Tax=Evansella vedderi TaxID=38282 RepID=A0ABT9ZYH0_9BACI|nr:NYN domain-containing protein [Evansella vedderi]MDQ0255518.1 uncharacterized LabA/DUF88 family protein [Evansella vedderi]
MKAAILVDEINAVSQLHALGIEGIRPWKKFFEAIHNVLKRDYGQCNVDYHMYGAIPPKHVDKQRYFNRKRFFSALDKDGIKVHKGLCHQSNGSLEEKGVDVMLSLDLYEFSLKHYDLLFVFSGDGDIVPAVERAQKNGAKVVAILSEKQPAKFMKRVVDGVVPLEGVIDLIDEQYVVRRSNTPKTTFKKESVC